jgi:4-amino-4-deoxy-L-arabinose transferase-like glycosyltransferase
MPREKRQDARDGRLAVAMLLAVAAAQYAWNAYAVEPLTGYDEPGHAGYILTLVRDGRLPHPMDGRGWSTFHPPVYYLVASAVWSLLEPLGPRALVVGLRAISAAACLTAGLAAHALVRRLWGSPAVALVAAAVVLFVPVVQMTAVMIGNEALAYGFGVLALLPLLTLQRDPRNARAAVLAGLCAGLAAATKFTGASVVAACAVPFLRADLDRRMVRALVVGALAGGLVVTPVYARNVLLTGTPFPFSREFEPMKGVEASQVLRPRRLVDYLWVDPACLLRPWVEWTPADPSTPERNPAMGNVWGLLYASTWWDAFGHRVPMQFHRDDVRSARVLMLLGLVPTGAMLAGFVLAVREALRRRGRSDDAPLVVVWLAGLAVFLSFTWIAPSVAAVKSSYLMPLVVPGAAFFARACAAAGRRVRALVLTVSAAAALAAAVVFTTGLVFPPQMKHLMVLRWKMVGGLLPDSRIGEAVDRLTVP